MYIFIDSKTIEAVAHRLMDSNFAGTVLAGTPETDDHYASGVVVSNRKTFAAGDLPTPDDESGNGSSTLRLYNLGDVTVIIESGDNDGMGIFAPGATILDYLSDLDFGDIDRAVGLAEFGYDDGPSSASDDDTDVRIWCRPNYYVGTLGAPAAHYARDEHYDDLVFTDVADAQAWIDAAESGVYVTAPGEAGRPEYLIVK